MTTFDSTKTELSKLIIHVRFRKIGLTNQRFNATARARAQATGVILIEQPELLALVEKHPISMQELSIALLR